MSTLAQIAASYGVQPIEFATLVGMSDLNPHTDLTSEQIAGIINAADGSDVFGGPETSGRHRFR